MTALSVSALHHTYGAQPVLRGLTLNVEPGAVTAILGASGSGKTTLLRVIAGFERAKKGVVRLSGATVDDGRRFVPPEGRRIGYVPQDGALFPHLTVQANIGFGLPRRGRAAHAHVLAELVGLGGLARRHPHELSGGQQRRVALARALAIRPDVVLLDEPFSSLDAALRDSVRTDVLSVLRTAGTTAILVTHDQGEALAAADTVAVLRDGAIAQHATPRELYTEPADPDLARMIGDANLIPAEIDGDHATSRLGRHPVRGVRPGGGTATASTGRAIILLRPEQLEVGCHHGPGRTGPGRASPGLTGHVLHSRYHGHGTLVGIRPDEPWGAPVLVARAAGHLDLRPGTSVTVTSHGPVTAYPPSDQAAGLLDNLGDGDLEDVPRPGRLQRGDQRVHPALGHDGLNRVHVTAGKRGDRR